MKPRDAFEICHEVYVVARELVDSHRATSQLQNPSKFLWRPDLRPRLVEYVADFALAGERALAPERPSSFLRSSAARPRPSASRLILFRMHHLGGAEWQTARRLLGISELTWADWVDEIKEHVGKELLRGGLFPPGRYFRVLSRHSTGGTLKDGKDQDSAGRTTGRRSVA